MLGVGLQSMAKWIQSALGITKCGMVDYKVCQGLKSVSGLQSELVKSVNITSFITFQGPVLFHGIC